MKKAVLLLSVALTTLLCSPHVSAMEKEARNFLGKLDPSTPAKEYQQEVNAIQDELGMMSKFKGNSALPNTLPASPSTILGTIKDCRAALGVNGASLADDIVKLNQSLGGWDYTTTKHRINLMDQIVLGEKFKKAPKKGGKSAAQTEQSLFNNVGLFKYSFLKETPPDSLAWDNFRKVEREIVPAPTGIIQKDLKEVWKVLVDTKPKKQSMVEAVENLRSTLVAKPKEGESLEEDILSRIKPLLIGDPAKRESSIEEDIIKLRELVTGNPHSKLSLMECIVGGEISEFLEIFSSQRGITVPPGDYKTMKELVEAVEAENRGSKKGKNKHNQRQYEEGSDESDDEGGSQRSFRKVNRGQLGSGKKQLGGGHDQGGEDPEKL